MAFRLGILGRVELRRTDGDGVRVAGRKARALTVVLALQRNRTVSLDRIAEALWDTEPPASALPNIRTYASAVRDALGPDKERLRTGDGGYRLRLAVDESDHATFLDLAERGRAALAGKQPRIAANLLERALRLWRGDEMAEGVPRFGPLAGWLDAAEAQRRRAVEDLAEARIGVGDRRAAVTELQELLAGAPLQMRAWHLLVHAHHALGEIDAAVRSYRRAETVFRQELGVKLDPAMNELYRALVTVPVG